MPCWSPAAPAPLLGVAREFAAGRDDGVTPPFATAAPPAGVLKPFVGAPTGGAFATCPMDGGAPPPTRGVAGLPAWLPFACDAGRDDGVAAPFVAFPVAGDLDVKEVCGVAALAVVEGGMCCCCLCGGHVYVKKEKELFRLEKQKKKEKKMQKSTSADFSLFLCYFLHENGKQPAFF